MDLEIRSPSFYSRAHHREGGGYANVWGPVPQTPALKAMQWILTRAFSGKENVPPPVVRTDPDALRTRPNRLRVTWIGHSSTFVQTLRLNLLIDPVFGARASPFSFAGPKREPELPFRIADLPGVDIVLLSHDHYDHLDAGSIREIHRRFDPLFLCPLGVAEILRGWGVRNVAELDWWQSVDALGARFYCTPAKHFSGRGLTNRNGTLWAGWYLELEDGLRVYYAGDSGYASLFTDVRERLGPPEVALIPIGAYLPRWFMEPVHMDPEEAVQAFVDVGAGHFIPVHWGTFDLADEPISEPIELVHRHMAERGLSERLHTLPIGGSFELEAGSRPEGT